MAITLAEARKYGIKLPPEIEAEIEAEQKKKKSKYNNTKPVIDGIKFDSKLEANEYCRLKLRKMAGDILDFERQVPFTLQASFLFGKRQIRPVKLIVDFLVTELDGSLTIREAKGVRTQAYRIKKKMFLKQYPGIKFVEVTE